MVFLDDILKRKLSVNNKVFKQRISNNPKNMATNGSSGVSSELLFHIKRTTRITDFAGDKSGATTSTDILGTFTELAAAKLAARSALASEGYVKGDFESFEENDGSGSWTHGDGVLAYAKAPAGQITSVPGSRDAPYYETKYRYFKTT
jgi:hypothetical protein